MHDPIIKNRIKMQYLQSIVYSNNDMGLKSLNNFKRLIPHIFEISLNNVHLNGGYLGNERYVGSDVVEEILDTCALEAHHLMKLKLTKINLKSEGIIKLLCDTLNQNVNMI